MVMRLHEFGKSPKFVGGKLVQPGTFYEAPDTELVITDDPNAPRVPFLGPPSGLNSIQNAGGSTIPAYDDITVNKMKEELDALSVDYSEHDKDKQTLYAFYAEVKKNAGNPE